MYLILQVVTMFIHQLQKIGIPKYVQVKMRAETIPAKVIRAVGKILNHFNLTLLNEIYFEYLKVHFMSWIQSTENQSMFYLE